MFLSTPFEILSVQDDTRTQGLFDNLGFGRLMNILNYGGLIAAVVIIICSLIMLTVVNYPKTVAQTKQKVVHALFVIIIIAAAPYLADVILGVIYDTLF